MGQTVDQRPIFAQCHFINNLTAKQRRCTLFHFRELRRHTGLQRKAPKKGRTKRVDRLNFQAARRFDGLGKQSPGFFQKLRGDFSLDPKTRKGFSQLIRVFHGPFAQALEQSVLHLACGGFGIGQAQNVLRLDPFKKKSGNPVRKHTRFSRSRVCLKPSGFLGSGGFDLCVCGLVPDHSRSSGLGASEISHSPKRARWSNRP